MAKRVPDLVANVPVDVAGDRPEATDGIANQGASRWCAENAYSVRSATPSVAMSAVTSQVPIAY